MGARNWNCDIGISILESIPVPDPVIEPTPGSISESDSVRKSPSAMELEPE